MHILPCAVTPFITLLYIWHRAKTVVVPLSYFPHSTLHITTYHTGLILVCKRISVNTVCFWWTLQSHDLLLAKQIFFLYTLFNVSVSDHLHEFQLPQQWDERSRTVLLYAKLNILQMQCVASNKFKFLLSCTKNEALLCRDGQCVGVFCPQRNFP